MEYYVNDFYRGDNKYIKLRIQKSDGEPIDLTGMTVYFTMKSNPRLEDVDAELQKSQSAHYDGVNGLTDIHVTSADTQNLVPRWYYYDLQLTDSNGNNVTLAAGKVRVLADITRA